MSSFLLSNTDGRWLVELNGQDITNMIADGGVKVVCHKWPMPPAVQLTLIPEKLRADLPGALVSFVDEEANA